MRLSGWLNRLFAPREGSSKPGDTLLAPLREFVYLDEVSLRSLLSSQKGEVVEGTSEQSVAAEQSELTAMGSVSAASLAKSEAKSRYQTSNSSTLQTSRKATVQSWFRDFHGLPGLRVMEPVPEVAASSDLAHLLAVTNRAVVMPAAELRRGDLVEFRVRLTADPVFRFGTLMSEFSGMADDSPKLFAGEQNTFEVLGQMEPVNRILQRLLAGLIPVRALSIDYVVVSVEGIEYITDQRAIADLDLTSRPLEIVGVTEHLAYWKDIRRVLFSEAEFTMLCRVARGALQSTWTPVKLANLFLPFAPDLVEQINTASRSSLDSATSTRENTNETALVRALSHYADNLLLEASCAPETEVRQSLDRLIAGMHGRASSASQQRSAFEEMRSTVEGLAKMKIEKFRDIELREEARQASGLPLFPALSQGMTTVVGEPSDPLDDQASRLLDVEVVSIYW